MPIKFIDLFSGCGGLSEPFLDSKKFEAIKIVDNDRYCFETSLHRVKKKYKIKDPNNIVVQADISSAQFINSFKKNEIDLVIGGPPCQAYSVAGRIRDKNSMKNDYRNYLFESFIKIVKNTKPKLFIMENVPGILSAKPGGINITERIKKEADSIGYFIPKDLKMCLFDMSEYGVPQKRKRVIIIGVKKTIKNYKMISTKFYDQMKKHKIKKIYTVYDAIGDLSKFYPLAKPSKEKGKRISHSSKNNKSSNLLSHFPRFHNERDIKIFKLLAKDIELNKFKYTTSAQLKKLYTKMVGKESNIHKYHVLRKDLPSNLIPAHLYKDGLRHIHYDSSQARSITVREAARLQTFDDNFEFKGPMTEQYKMIGNAVPPKFANIILKTIVNLI